jgi:DNA-binding NarL/FixJ family response regulator
MTSPTDTPTKAVLIVVEDDPDTQLLVEMIFSMDPRFRVAHVADSAKEAIEAARKTQPATIVLDHGLTGALTGTDAAPLLKYVAPKAKIILFTAYGELQAGADAEPAIDAFLHKTQSPQLLPLARRLLGLDAPQS